jgi:hypothetical protein
VEELIEPFNEWHLGREEAAHVDLGALGPGTGGEPEKKQFLTVVINV